MRQISLTSRPRRAWEVDESGFPRAGTVEEKLRFLVYYAVLAPSTRNTQPWIFRTHNNAIDLLMDPTRALPVTDPEHREMIISCGAAAFNLRVAIRHFGYLDRFMAFPDPAEPSLLARIGLGAPAIASKQEELLFHAIKLRRTYRHPFLDRALPEPMLYRLKMGARQDGMWLHFLDKKPEREAMVKLIAEAEYRQLHNGAARREILSWMHPAPRLDQDGVPAYALGSIPHVRAPGMAVFGARKTKLDEVTLDSENLARVAPALAVLGTASDDPGAWLRVGQTLEEILLSCAADRVFVSFMNQPVQIAELRPRVAEIVGETGYAQIILRLGYGASATPTPRRSTEDVLIS
ncbi:MAG TPA: nitroreductase [Armatimonadota bacterium]|nr:nitroreductase [Armatimonadota bacterium]